MIKASFIPKEPFYLAFSGGTDSLVVAHFLSQSHASKMTLLYVNHGTEFGQFSENKVKDLAQSLNLPLDIYHVTQEPNKGQSLEEFWRNERMSIFHAQNRPVVTAHHLDDCLETWIFSSLHGLGKIIPLYNKNIVRPFLLTKKKDLERYAERKGIIPLEDPSNLDVRFARNNIRHNIVPLALDVNPGLHKTVARKVERMMQDTNVNRSCDAVTENSCKPKGL